MLFENDGSAADVLNAYAEIYGDGVVMDAMRKKLVPIAEQRSPRIKRAIERAAMRVKEAKERRVIEEMGDLCPDFEVPREIYDDYASAAKLKAEEMGVTLDCNGYGWWTDSGNQAWFRRTFPELCYCEEKRPATIIKTFAELPQRSPLLVA